MAEKNQVNVNFGETLSECRKAAGLTRKALAEQLKLNENSIWYYEQGERTPTFENLIKIADLLGVSIDNLLRGDKATVAAESKVKYAVSVATADKSYPFEVESQRFKPVTLTITITPKTGGGSNSGGVEVAEN